MNVLITGATGGIGKALIDVFIKNNYHVIALGRNRKELKNLQNKYGHMILCYSIDLSVEYEIDVFLNFLKERKIRIHLLINGAGIGELNYFEKTPYLKLKKMMDINITALTRFTSYFYKEMCKRGGTIINISSTAGFQCGGPLMAVYYATKSYVNSLTYSLRREARDKKVKIILLAPGPTKTTFVGIPKKLSFMEKLYITTPEEVANELYKGVVKNRFLIIPGKINKLLYYIDKILPGKISISLVEKIQKNKLLNKKDER